MILRRLTTSEMAWNAFKFCSALRAFGSIMIVLVVGILCLTYYAVVFATYGPALFRGGLDSLTSLFVLLTFHPLVGMVLWSYFSVILTDPGGVPPNWRPPTDEERGDWDPFIGSEAHQSTVHGDPPNQKVRYCQKCKHYKPPRSHHCSVCGRCILRMDHHCVWVVNCVGVSNYKYFVLFLFYTFLATAHVTLSLVPVFINFFGDGDLPGDPGMLAASFVTFTRHLGFMLRGLQQLHLSLEENLHIPFFLVRGEAEDTIPNFLNEHGASLLVTDFSPLREVRKCKDEICKRVSDSLSIHEVDAHNVVPTWVASEKLEYAAKTIRTKIHKQLSEYLIDFPTLQAPIRKWAATNRVINWDCIIGEILRKGAEVPEITWCEPGEKAAMEVLMGSKDGFLTKRLKNYSTDRNNPLKPRSLSGLSPYLHFGQISAQRCAMEAHNVRVLCPPAIDAFFEELVVRRELADNFCFYQPHYDSLQGAWEWARKTLLDHASDKREHLYTREQLEKAQTADPLWNASQLEMVYHGKMHGFMRMYWAKKILEWTRGPEEALEITIYLNDKYEIDGRDPNGYVGCMWSICGIHDQGWKERPIFGKIRYMNYAGCKRKFDVDGYIGYVKRMVGEIKKQKSRKPS